jgi:hypothetical protein
MTVTSVALGSDPLEQRLDRLLTQATSGGDKPGIAVAIQRGTQVIYSKGFGYADVEHRIPVTPDTVFPIGLRSRNWSPRARSISTPLLENMCPNCLRRHAMLWSVTF